MSKITIDKLAGIIKNEFDTIGKRFDGVDKRFERLEKKVEEGFERVELKLCNVAYRFEMQELEARVNLLAEKVDLLEKRK